MVKVILIGAVAALLWCGVVQQNIVHVNTARAKELAYAPAVIGCEGAKRALLAKLRADGEYSSPETLAAGRELVRACKRVQRGADQAQLERMVGE